MIISKIKDLSIIKKMLLMVFSTTIFFVLYLGMGYFVAYQNKIQIENIEKYKLPIHAISMENLRLFEDLKVSLDEKIYKKILFNLEKLKELEKYGVDKKQIEAEIRVRANL